MQAVRPLLLQGMVRYELFFKSPAQLANLIPVLRANSVTAVNIPNKSRDDPLEECLRLLQSELPHVDVCLHFSLRYGCVDEVSPRNPNNRSPMSLVPLQLFPRHNEESLLI